MVVKGLIERDAARTLSLTDRKLAVRRGGPWPPRKPVGKVKPHDWAVFTGKHGGD
jgi:hypothetical protein